MKKEINPKSKLIFAFIIFGTTALFVKASGLPSGVISAIRGIIGGLFILLLIAIKKEKIDKELLKKNLLMLIITGIIMGINWVLLFDSYKYQTIAVSTILYYLEPVYLTLSATILFKEKMTLRKIICVLVALLGMVFVSGLFSGGKLEITPKGFIMALVAGLLYAVVVILNKKIVGLSSNITTSIELLAVGIIMIPYSLINEPIGSYTFDFKAIFFVLVIALFNTGFIYSIYFAQVRKLSASTVGLFGYLDPIVSIILSSIILKEAFTLEHLIGAVLIIGSSFVSEFDFKKIGK